MKITASTGFLIAGCLLLSSCHPIDLTQRHTNIATNNVVSEKPYIVKLSDGRIETYIERNGVKLPRSTYPSGTPDASYLESIYGPLEVDVPKPLERGAGTIIMNPDRSLSIFRGPISSPAGIIETRPERILPSDPGYQHLIEKYGLKQPYDGAILE